MLFDAADALSIPPSVIQEQLTEIQWADHINAGAIAQILGQGLGNFVEFLTNLFLVLLYLVNGRALFAGWKILFPTAAEPPGQLG
jgi:hypothetical protein